jgi:hypothetical protein
VHRKDIPIYIQQYVTLHSLFYLETALHISGGTTTNHQERKQLYLQHLVFVIPLLLPAAIVEELERSSALMAEPWQQPTKIHVNKPRSCNYSLDVPDDER